MVADFFAKPLQGSMFTKMRNYVMGNEEPGYQVLPRSVLSNDNITGIRNQKTIGTRKHNLEATKNMGHAKDSDASGGDHPVRNTQGMSSSMCGIGDKRLNRPGVSAEQHDEVSRNVEPRSYWDVVVNG